MQPDYRALLQVTSQSPTLERKSACGPESGSTSYSHHVRHIIPYAPTTDFQYLQTAGKKVDIQDNHKRLKGSFCGWPRPQVRGKEEKQATNCQGRKDQASRNRDTGSNKISARLTKFYTRIDMPLQDSWQSSTSPC